MGYVKSIPLKIVVFWDVTRFMHPTRSRRSSKVKDPMRGPLFYIPRFIRHYRDRRQLGQSIGQSLKSARVRMQSYR